ncbi:hypothetical protein E3N88_10452 [Mikania micrantha]|uniref:DDE Tnp4 domain-containing protein n=1 Tax=Mikania micrantha TaxID=192012 RepID=A0A5N6PAI7_9ASTR|nr:hypothetical protein E3N88_10452 [Mikania micrantha]
MLEAVAFNDLWIWHAYFGVSGSNNDINVLDQSPIFDDILDRVAPGSSFYANNTYYKYVYYLADGIYHENATFVKSFTCPREDDDRQKYFKKAQEAVRKDVERAFGVLKKKWYMIHNSCRIWHKSKIRDAMYACIILHNMILDDKGKAICQNYEDVDPPVEEVTPEERVEIRAEIRSREIHNML